MPVARKLFDHTSSFADPVDRARLLDLLYAHNYPKTTGSTCFRAGAAETLAALQGPARARRAVAGEVVVPERSTRVQY